MNKNANTSRSFLLKTINQEITQKLKTKCPTKINHLTPKEQLEKFETIQIQFDNPVIVFSPQCELYQEIKINRKNTKPNSVKINENCIVQKTKDIFQSQIVSSSSVEDEIIKSSLQLEKSVLINNIDSFISFSALTRNTSSSLLKQSLLYLKNISYRLKNSSMKTRSKSNNNRLNDQRNKNYNKSKKMDYRMSLFLPSNSQSQKTSQKEDNFSNFANQKFTEIAFIYIQ